MCMIFNSEGGKKMKLISIIIPVYNNPKELELTLNSILLQDFSLEEIEVLVVDDGSTIDMEKVTNCFADKFLIRYFWQQDKGFCPGTARNMGIRVASGAVCVFLDSGVILTKKCLEKHFQRYQEYGEKLCVIGYTLGNDTCSDLDEMRQIIDKHTPDEAEIIMRERNMLDGRERMYKNMGDDLALWPAPYTMLWSMHFSVPTKFMQENSLYFDEYFSTWGCEDNDFGITLLKCGARYVLARDAVAIHYPAHARSYDKLHNDPDFRAGWQKNREYLRKKYADDKVVQRWLQKGTWAANHPDSNTQE